MLSPGPPPVLADAGHEEDELPVGAGEGGFVLVLVGRGQRPCRTSVVKVGTRRGRRAVPRASLLQHARLLGAHLWWRPAAAPPSPGAVRLLRQPSRGRLRGKNRIARLSEENGDSASASTELLGQLVRRAALDGEEQPPSSTVVVVFVRLLRLRVSHWVAFGIPHRFLGRFRDLHLRRPRHHRSRTLVAPWDRQRHDRRQRQGQSQAGEVASFEAQRSSMNSSFPSHSHCSTSWLAPARAGNPQPRPSATGHPVHRARDEHRPAPRRPRTSLLRATVPRLEAGRSSAPGRGRARSRGRRSGAAARGPPRRGRRASPPGRRGGAGRCAR